MDNKEFGFYEYEVTFFDEFDTDKQHPYGKMTTAKGITAAKTYSKAIKNITRHYDGIETITIVGLEPGHCYDINYEPYMLHGENLVNGR